MNSVLVTDFRAPVLDLLPKAPTASISPEAVDNAVRAVVALQLYERCKLTDDQSGIVPKTSPDPELYPLLVKYTLLHFHRHLSKEQIAVTKNEIYELENGEGCG